MDSRFISITANNYDISLIISLKILYESIVAYNRQRPIYSPTKPNLYYGVY